MSRRHRNDAVGLNNLEDWLEFHARVLGRALINPPSRLCPARQTGVEFDPELPKALAELLSIIGSANAFGGACNITERK